MRPSKVVFAVSSCSCVLFLVLSALAGSARATTTQATTRSGLTCASGTMAAGVYVSMTITGFCSLPPRGSVDVLGNFTVERSAVFDGATDADLDVRGNMVIGAGAIVAVGCDTVSVLSHCTDDTDDVISGNVVDNNGLAVIFNGYSVDGNVTMQGGGGGTSCKEVTRDGFDLSAFSAFEDGWIDGSVNITDVKTCWLGLFRNGIGGNVTVTAVHTQRPAPSAPGIAGNVIAGSLSCTGNDPRPTLGTSVGMPSVAAGGAFGQCAAIASAAPPRCSVTYANHGSYSLAAVPGVAYNVTLVGAGGGGGVGNEVNFGADGGPGGEVQATITPTSSGTLTVVVGEGGGAGIVGGAAGAGGTGEGSGGEGGNENPFSAGGGGGGSAVLTGSTVILDAGGGGGGGASNGSPGGPGGAGIGSSGGAGDSGSVAGAGGAESGPNGGLGATNGEYTAGGGGGGGYLGGTGGGATFGSGAGGGGGSSYTRGATGFSVGSPSVSTASNGGAGDTSGEAGASGENGGDGSVTISWCLPPPPGSVTYANHGSYSLAAVPGVAYNVTLVGAGGGGGVATRSTLVPMAALAVRFRRRSPRPRVEPSPSSSAKAAARALLAVLLVLVVRARAAEVREATRIHFRPAAVAVAAPC